MVSKGQLEAFGAEVRAQLKNKEKGDRDFNLKLFNNSVTGHDSKGPSVVSRRRRIAITYRASIYKNTIQHSQAIEQCGGILAKAPA